MSSNRSPVLVISGLPLLNPYVGVGVYTLRLIRGLAKLGRIPFLVLLPREAEASADLLPERCFRLVNGGPRWKLPVRGKLLCLMQKISNVARRDYPDAIFHSPGPFWSFHPPARTVVTLHDCIYRRFPFYLGSFLIGKWMAHATERFAAAARLVLTVSECSAADLRESAGIPAEKIRVVYPWVEDRFNPELARKEAPRVRAKYNLPENFFLYVGGYDYRKNVRLLLEAYARAKAQGPLWPLVLAGKIFRTSHRTMCDVEAALREAGLGADDVLRPGLIDDADMPGLYGAARILVFPSRYEGFGFPPIEAAASGIPVLVADNSSLREIVTATHNRFPADDPEFLAKLLRLAYKDSSQFVCPEDPRFREKFAISAYMETMNAVFASALT